MSKRTLTTVAAVSALVLPAGVAAAAPADEPGPDRPPQAAAPEGASTDRDGDRIADDLAPRLRRADADEPLRVIVTGMSSARARGLVGGFRLAHELTLIDGFAATMRAGQARALARHPAVRRLEADGVVHALDDASDRDFGAAAARADLPGLDGDGVGICVIDTGVDPGHEQIAPRTVAFRDFVNGRAGAYDDHGHGTHVASIAAGDGVGGSSAASFGGVAPAAELYAAKVLSASGSGSDSDVAAAVQWCHEQPGVAVQSLSLGSGPTDGKDAVSLAVDAAVAGGDVVVVAAGNSGDVPGSVSAPGVAAGAMTVGAVSDHSAPAGTPRRDDGIWLAAFSSRGPTLAGLVKPDVVAPGVTVTAADAGTTAGYVTYSGTSMATPYVSGAVALALEAAPTSTPGELKAALTTSAHDVGPAGKDPDWGAGLVDVRAFVDSVLGEPVQRTAFPAWRPVTGTVPDNGAVEVPLPVGEDALGMPLAVTLTSTSGSLRCDFLCQIGFTAGEWSPDLDIELRDPAGVLVADSQCALSGLSCATGRQETIGVVPATAGTWTLRVVAFPGSPNNGRGGSFALDVFHGPLGGSTPEPPPPPPPVEENQPPVADAGDDLTAKIAKKATEATFTLDGTRSHDPDAAPGESLGYRWTDASGAVVGTAATVTLQRPAGTYGFTLVVTDVDGASSAPDAVTVTVTGAGKPPRR
ncbi:MAG TPA: S8 family serine peptidase [Nocardioidaceae bacterium]